MIKTMTESLQIPHMGYGDEVNMNALMECRRQVATNKEQRLSVLVYCIKATSLALLDYPQLNSTLCTDTMTLKQSSSHHIGIAMDTPRGLAVPIVRHVESLSLLEISTELNRLKELAKDGALSEQDVGAGASSSSATFTLSNIGAVGGGTYMSPVVAPPQVGIGAMGKVRRLPRFVDNDEDDSLEVEAAHMMNISWAADHRAVDGATLARFSNTWKAYLESPTSMMMKMK
uniref:2-oxoacid dehydrogenase acyltransferase catalytic domain-containing protein n=1 Tax=Grammatophora oceanica TaxID=210454 RepID=A0A7S1Y2A0_9STRA|mmetsp:Transcript_12058/g.17688  ORF Transcript_12058/g.17688 Transcript_12058/m.17688 type:complete len:230 (+) Transcript_12058:197-886(+)